jgi:hypothetical protein
MNDNIAEVNEHPVGIGFAFNAYRWASCFLGFDDNIVCQR